MCHAPNSASYRGVRSIATQNAVVTGVPQSATVIAMSASAQQTGWTPTTESFGARLALIRQGMGWRNLKEAADACGVPVQSWRNWEADISVPRDYVEVVRKICTVTGVDYYWLLDENKGFEYVAAQQVSRKNRGRARRDSNPQPSDP